MIHYIVKLFTPELRNFRNYQERNRNVCQVESHRREQFKTMPSSTVIKNILNPSLQNGALYSGFEPFFSLPSITLRYLSQITTQCVPKNWLQYQNHGPSISQFIKSLFFLDFGVSLQRYYVSPLVKGTDFVWRLFALFGLCLSSHECRGLPEFLQLLVGASRPSARNFWHTRTGLFLRSAKNIALVSTNAISAQWWFNVVDW